MNDVITCPACERKVQLPREYLGRNVQCPECKRTFLAGDPMTGIATDPSLPPMPSISNAPESPTALDEAAPRYPARHDDDDAFDDWGVRRAQLRRDHGGVVLALGILSVVIWCLGAVFGPIAFFVGGSDLRAMDNGEMDPANRSMVQAGRIIGAVGFCLSMMYLLFYLGYFVFLASVVGG